MSEDIDALRRLVAVHARIEDPTNECSRLIQYLARAVDELEAERNVLNHSFCVEVERHAAAEQDAARLAEALRANMWCDPPIHNCSMRVDGHEALAAHEARVKGGAP